MQQFLCVNCESYVSLADLHSMTCTQVKMDVLYLDNGEDQVNLKIERLRQALLRMHDRCSIRAVEICDKVINFCSDRELSDLQEEAVVIANLSENVLLDRLVQLLLLKYQYGTGNSRTRESQSTREDLRKRIQDKKMEIEQYRSQREECKRLLDLI